MLHVSSHCAHAHMSMSCKYSLSHACNDIYQTCINIDKSPGGFFYIRDVTKQHMNTKNTYNMYTETYSKYIPNALPRLESETHSVFSSFDLRAHGIYDSSTRAVTHR